MDYRVGYNVGIIEDPERQAWRADVPRPLNWAAWYPASPDAMPRELFIGPPGAELFTMGAVARGADMSRDQERWPVVLLSHGTGGTAQSLAWLGCHLAIQRLRRPRRLASRQHRDRTLPAGRLHVLVGARP